MSVKRVLLGASALVLSVVGAVVGSGPPAAAARVSTAAPGPTVAWGTTSSAPAGYRGTLYGVASAGPAEAWAVGADNPDSSVSQVLDQPYAEHWNGSGWTATPVSAPALYGTHQAAALTAVASVGPGEAWAVGDVSDNWSVASQTLAYHFTGGTWTVTWTGPVDHSGTSDVSGSFAVGGLPDGTYTVESSYSGCTPGVATATVTAGVATPVNAPVTC